MRAISAPYSVARAGTDAMSGSSYWPRSAVYAQGTAPLARIQATATEVSRPPENAIPTRSPTGRLDSTLDMHSIVWCVAGPLERAGRAWAPADRLRCNPPHEEGITRASNRSHRRPVGRRGQGQGD